MAHRTGFGAGITLVAAMFPPRLAAQPEERESVPRCSRRGAYRRTQRSMDLAAVLEAVFTDPNDNVLAAVTPHQHRARNGQARILGWLCSRFGCAPWIQFFLQEILRRANTKVGIVGDFKRS